MKRMFLIVALAIPPVAGLAQVQNGINRAPGQPAFGPPPLPLPGNIAPSVPPGGTNPSGTGPGYAPPPLIGNSNATSGSRNTSLGSVGPAVRPGGNAPSGDDIGSPGSEAEARAKVAHAGYGNVGAMTRGSDGVWRGTAKLDTMDVRVEVDMFGAVRAY